MFWAVFFLQACVMFVTQSEKLEIAWIIASRNKDKYIKCKDIDNRAVWSEDNEID